MLAKIACCFSPWKVGRVKPKNVGVVVPTRRLGYEVHISAKFVRNDDDRSLTVVLARGIEMRCLSFATVGQDIIKYMLALLHCDIVTCRYLPESRQNEINKDSVPGWARYKSSSKKMSLR